MAEGARLESVYTLTGIVGSNPTLSAIKVPDSKPPLLIFDVQLTSNGRSIGRQYDVNQVANACLTTRPCAARIDFGIARP